MSEPTKTRFTIDLDEIDRQLRRAATPAEAPRLEPEVEPFSGEAAAPDEVPVSLGGTPIAQPSPQGADPLRELARIVGQDDPFQSLLGNPATGLPPTGSAFPQAAGIGGHSGGAPYAGRLDFEFPVLQKSKEVGDLAGYLRPETAHGETASMPSSYDPYGSYDRALTPSAGDFGAAETLAAQGGTQAPSQNPQAAPEYGHYQQGQPEAPVYAQQSQPYGESVTVADHSAAAPHAYEQEFEEYTPSYANPSLGYQPGYHPEEEAMGIADASQRKKWLLRGGVAIVAVGLAAGAYGVMRSKGIVGKGEPPVVVASDGPTKVAPSEPDGKEFPDQNKQIYQSGANEGRTQVVNREEQPLDIKQATGANTSSLTNADSLGDARKVKTIVVTVQGQRIGGDADAPMSPSASSQAQQRPLPNGPAMGGVPPATRPAAAAPPSAAGATPSSNPTPAAQATTSATQPPAAPARPRATQPSATTPAATPSALPQRTTAAAAPPGNAATPAPRATGGPYVVQFGTAGSEAEGRAKFARMKSQYGAALNGVSANVQAGSTANGTIYRIRSGGMSKEAADSLCNNLKSSTSNAGVCFVVRN